MKTPQQSYPKLAKALGLQTDIYLKREDLHTYGSHKGRSIPLMIKQYAKEGMTHFVISSSGNAALAAILAVQAFNQNNREKSLFLHVLVGQHIDLKKMNRLRAAISDDQITIEQDERPKQKAFQMEKDGTAKNLRQSTDDLAIEGYIELGLELVKIPELSAIFIPVSSGTTVLGIAKGCEEKAINPALHIVQTPDCHPIATALGAESVQQEEPSLAGAIVDNIAHRKNSVIADVQSTHGAGWIISNREIEEMMAMVKKECDLDLSPNGVLALCAIKKAVDNGASWNGPVVALVCGL